MGRRSRPVGFLALGLAVALVGVPLATAAGGPGGGTPLPPSAITPLLKLLRNLTVQSQPEQPTFDPVNGKLYVPNYGSGTVSVIKGSTNRVVHNITVGLRPVHAVYDNATDQLYVLNLGSNSVSVISGATDRVVRTVNVSRTLEPVGIYDPANGDVYVLSIVSPPSSFVVSHINKTSGKVRAIAVGPASQIFYDPANSDLITTNTLASNLSVIGPRATRATTVTLPSGLGPATLTYDPFNGQAYITDTGFSGSAPPGPTGNVTVLSSAAKVVATVKVGQLPVLATVDPVHHDVYVVNEGYATHGVVPNSSVSVLGPANSVVKTIPLAAGGLMPTYDPAAGEIFVACSVVNKTYVINTTTNSVVAKLTTRDHPDMSFVDPRNGDVIVLPAGGTSPTLLTVLSPANRVLGTITIGTGLPSPAYDPANGDVYIANFGSATVSVLR